MVDTPVGKKCRECAAHRTHLVESDPRRLTIAAVAALVVALPAGWLMQQLPLLILPAAAYGWLVGEVTLRASGRRTAMPSQIIAGACSAIGALFGLYVHLAPLLGQDAPGGLPVSPLLIGLVSTGIGVFCAVGRVRSF